MLVQQTGSNSQIKETSKNGDQDSKNGSGTHSNAAVSGTQATINMLLAGSSPRATPQQLEDLKKALEKEPGLKGFTLENLKVQSINGEYVVTATLAKDGEPKAAVAFRKQEQGSPMMYVGIDPGKRTAVLTSDFSNSFCLSLSNTDSFSKTALQGLAGAPETHSLAMVNDRTGVALSADIAKTREKFDPNRPNIVLDGNNRVSAAHPEASLDELSVNDNGKVYHPEKVEFSTEKGARVVKVYYKVDGEMREATFKGERYGRDVAQLMKKAGKDAAIEEAQKAGAAQIDRAYRGGKIPPP